MNEPGTDPTPSSSTDPDAAGFDLLGDEIRPGGVARRRFLYSALGTVVLGGGAAAAVVFGSRDDTPSNEGTGSVPDATTSTTEGPSLTTAATQPTVPAVDDPLLALPDPDGPPADAYAPVPVNQIGSIQIPRIELDHAVYEGVWLTVLDVGPGHWPGSAMPGQLGNSVFPGHRVTHSHPFRRLDELAPGDEVVFTMANGTHTYKVRETLIVSPKDIWVVDSNPNSEVTLIACHPPHSARQRIVVKGELAKSTPNAAAATAAGEIADLADDIPL